MSLIAAATQVASRSAYVMVSRRLIEFPSGGLPAADPRTRSALFQFGLISFLIQAAQRVVGFSSSLLIASFTNLQESAVYGVAQSLSNKCRDVSKTLSDQLMPTASRLHARQDPHLMQRIAVLSCRMLGLIALVFLVNIATLGIPFFNAWLGKPSVATAAHPISVILLAGMLIKLTVGGLVTSLEGMGSMTLLGRICAIEAVLTLVVQALALRAYGLQGMAIGLLLCQLLVNGLLLTGLAARTMALAPGTLLLRIWSPLLLTAIPGLVVGWSCNRWLPPSSIWAVLAEFSIVGFTLLAVGFFTCLDPEGKQDLQLALSRRFGKHRLPTTSSQ